MDKLPQKEIACDNKLVKWFKNYWYYYKWIVIGLLFAALVVLVCVFQTCSNSKSDISILYAGPFPSSDNGVPKMENALAEVLPEDFNGDKEKRVSLAMLMIYTEEQMKEIEANRKDVKIDRQSNRRELEKFQSLVINGEHAVCLLDPSLFDMVKDAEGFVKLSEVLGYSPRGAVNDYAVRLSDLPFGQFFSGIKDLPRDTYLCLRTPGAIQSVSGAGKGSDKFEQAVRMVKAIIEFEFPDNYVPDAK